MLIRCGIPALVLALILPAAGPAQLPPGDVVCRQQIARSTLGLTDTLIKERGICHALRMKGTIPSSIECSDPLQAPGSTGLARARLKMVTRIDKGCARASSPAANGYILCPSPCDGVAITGYASTAECFRCVSEYLGSVVVDLAYGRPPAPAFDRAERSCQKLIGAALRKYLGVRVREQQRCQFAEDRAPTGIDCMTADARGKVARARTRARDTIARCAPHAFAALDSCGTDLPSEQNCIEAAANFCADALFHTVYRPGLPTPTPSGIALKTPTPTTTPTSAPTHTFTPTATPPPTSTPTPTLPPTFTPTPLPPVHVDINEFPPQSEEPCLIFVHGKRTDTGTFTNWNQARDYWISGSRDFIQSATRNFTASYYVIGYNGTQAYWNSQSAGHVASEIVNATNGNPDGGGNRCARTYDEGGTFWVVAHSMGPSLLDFILGNADPSDPNYNLNGPYDVAAARISLVISIAGTHRGSQGADLVCGGGNPICSFFAQFVQDCDEATYWLRSSDDVQVRAYASSPARTVWLTSGYAAIIGASACLAGEDDGLVQFASAYACNGSATAGYNVGNVCDNNNKQETAGFKNLDAAHENHDQERNDTDRDTRRAVATGAWICDGVPCLPDTAVQGSMSTAQLVGALY